MPDPVTGIIGGTAVIGAVTQSKSAKRAANAQVQSNAAGIAEQRRQFDEIQRLLQPYTAAGGPALQSIMALAGLGGGAQTDWGAYARANPAIMESYAAQQQTPYGNAGAPYGLGDGFVGPGSFLGGRAGLMAGTAPGAYGAPPMSLEQFAQQYYQQHGGDISQFTTDPQAAAVARLEGSPMFQALARQGEEAILQNASATGGLRGGNVQGALARFRPQLLNQFIEQQYGRQAGIAALGQQSAAGVGAAGLQTGSNIADRLAASGAAQAAGIGAQGQIFANTIGQLGGIFAGAVGGNPLSRLAPSVNSAMAANPGIF